MHKNLPFEKDLTVKIIEIDIISKVFQDTMDAQKSKIGLICGRNRGRRYKMSVHRTVYWNYLLASTLRHINWSHEPFKHIYRFSFKILITISVKTLLLIKAFYFPMKKAGF